MIAECPPDWVMLHWHIDPGSKRYRTPETAQRAVRWLNANEGEHDAWLFRVGPVVNGRVVLERRWVGHWDGAVG